jgi:hypothetical protein
MKVSEEFDTQHGGKIQVAKNSDGGNSSWGNKEEYSEDSIRLAWYKEKGGFDPISSAELPMWGLKELMKVAAQKDMLSKSDVAELIGYLTASIYRQL